MKSSPNPQSTARQVRKLSRLRPTLGFVLGSGFQGAVARMKVEVEIPYQKLAGFPPVGVKGHSGKLFLGKLGGTAVAVLSGRAHFYEGHSLELVTFAVRTLAEFGIKDLLLTNAAGGINKKYKPGDFMMITDHINLMGMNPLRGPALPTWPRFVDMTRAYSSEMSGFLHKAGKRCKIRLRKGIYLAVCGPSYETPSEIEAFARLGADAVGMSTVPEVIVARQCGLQVAGLSCITNMAAGLGSGTLSHEEVLETAERVQSTAGFLLESFAAVHAESR